MGLGDRAGRGVARFLTSYHRLGVMEELLLTGALYVTSRLYLRRRR